jgi:hypothetical protein
MNEAQSSETDKNDLKPRRTWKEWLTSDLVLGTLVVVFTVTTALAAYLGSITDIKGDDLDLKSQNTLILGTTTFLQTSFELSEDLLSYQSYQLLIDRDPAAAALIFDSASSDLQDKMATKINPFDEAYREQIYKEAFGIFEEVAELQKQADAADEQSERYESAAFILAIGLAITAWASLYDARPKLRLTFTLIALPCLAVGVLILLSTAVSAI